MLHTCGVFVGALVPGNCRRQGQVFPSARKGGVIVRAGLVGTLGWPSAHVLGAVSLVHHACGKVGGWEGVRLMFASVVYRVSVVLCMSVSLHTLPAANRPASR